MKNKKSLLIMAIMLVIIIIGAVMCVVKGFNIELLYMERAEIVVSTNTDIDVSKVQEIAESVLEYKRVKVLSTGEFGNSVEIISTEITDDEKAEIISQINEEYSLELESDDIDIMNIPSTRIRDVLSPYILPGIISFVVVLLYFIIVYRKLGAKKLLLNGICLPILIELTYYALIAITRIPFGRITNALAIGIYVISILGLTIYFQKEIKKIPETNKKESEE